MDLNDFIKDVIVSVYDGISKAKQETGFQVIPSGLSASEGIPYVVNEVGPRGSKSTLVSNLHFEVSLTESTKDGSTGGIGVMLGNLGIGVKGNNESNQSSLSKIKFNIPIEIK